ncbi:hypothetical protein LSAT2_024252 [Lamellibrachia satsuma]|nr:hypothetical protein LSAT2_024252 [Lamellibrachia satsuma]
MGRRLRTAIPMVPSSLKPKWSYFQNMNKKQTEIKKQQKQAFDKRHRVVDLRQLRPGEQRLGQMRNGSSASADAAFLHCADTKGCCATQSTTHAANSSSP